jgi:lysine 2,3-aminomutase
MERETSSTEDFEPPSPAIGLEDKQLETIFGLSPKEKCHKGNKKIIAIRGTSCVSKFASSPRVTAFRKQFFPNSTPLEWNDWRWQLGHRIRDIHTLSRILLLSEDERVAITGFPKQIPVAITPYYMSLLAKDNPSQPLRRTVVPSVAERFFSPGEREDPLGEEHDSALPGLVHRYPDRVLFLVTDFCSTYCRYCTRSRMLGNGKGLPFDKGQWERAIAYIENTPAVRDVLLSGGDP